MSYYCGFREKLDRNWAWVILFASFWNQFISNGIPLSLGIYNVEFLEQFGDTKANTALVSSIHFAFLLGSGPIVSYAMERTSSRLIACLGAAISTSGVLLSVFATELIHLYITIGVIMGVGSCMVFIPSVVLVGLYFTKYRTFATSMSSVGGAVGCLVFPLMFAPIIEKYTWRGSMYINAAFCAQMMVFAALLRPIKPLKESDDQLNIESDTKFKTLDKDSGSEMVVLNDCGDSAPTRAIINGLRDTEKLLLVVGTKESNRSAEDLNMGKSNECNTDNACSSPDADHINTAQTGFISNINHTLQNSVNDSEHKSYDSKIHLHNSDHIALHGAEKGERESLLFQTDPSHGDTLDVDLGRDHMSHITHIDTTHLQRMKTNRMEKDLKEIKGCPEKRASEQHQHMGPTRRRINVIKHRLSNNILCNVDFLIWFINNLFWNLGTSIVIILTADYIYGLGTEKSQVSIVLMVTGFGDIIGTSIGSLLGDWKHCNRSLVFAILCLFNGIVSGLYTVSSSLIVIRVFGTLFGITIGWFMGWTVSVTADIVGISRLGEAFGYLMLANGIGNLAGPPLGGLLFDMTGDYTATFWMAGAITFASGLLMLTVPLKKIYRRKDSKDTPEMLYVQS